MSSLLVSLFCRQNSLSLFLVHIILKLKIYGWSVNETTWYYWLLCRRRIAQFTEGILCEEICILIVCPSLWNHIWLLYRWCLIAIVGCSSEKHIKSIALTHFLSDNRLFVDLIFPLIQLCRLFQLNVVLLLLYFLCCIWGTSCNAKCMKAFVVISKASISIIR